MSKSGNVHREEKPEAEEIPEFQPGDVVSLTPAAIRRSGISNMTPRVLYEIGHPNQFHVWRSFEDEQEGPCVTLVECCSWEKNEGHWEKHEGYIDRKSGKRRCTGHPSIHFEKKGKKRMPKKGDKSSSIHLPFMEYALAGLQWEEDENNPALKAHVMGKELSLTGPIAKIIKQLAEENNVL